VPELSRRIDERAAEAGRDPDEIRRGYNVSGTIADGPVQRLLDGPPEHGVETLTAFAAELGFDTFTCLAARGPGRTARALRRRGRSRSASAPRPPGPGPASWRNLQHILRNP
jgi:hypothetical protein